MIAALYASHSTGTANCFSMQGTQFGWKAIEDMLKREVERMKKSELDRVPGLKENYVYRDSWTRLNVKPAKIMQVFIHVHTCIMGSYMLIQCGLCINYMDMSLYICFSCYSIAHAARTCVSRAGGVCTTNPCTTGLRFCSTDSSLSNGM